jgi:hypothetical protein
MGLSYFQLSALDYQRLEALEGAYYRKTGGKI